MVLDIKRARKPSRKRIFKIVSEDTTEQEEVTIPLRELFDGVYCDEGRNYLYQKKIVDVENEDGETVKEARYSLRGKQPSGMPRLVSCYTVDGRSPSKKLDEQTFYTTEWSHRPDFEPMTFTERETNTGEFTAATPGIIETSKRERDFLAKVVKSQLLAFNIPVGRAKRTTGWHQDGKTGQWNNYLRDGRYYDGTGWIDPDIPIVGYDFRKNGKYKTQYNAWKEQGLPQKATSADGVKLLAWQRKVDPTGKLPLLTAYTYRALISSFVPVGTATVSCAKDGTPLHDGSSMSGKTTLNDFARGVDGPCPFESTAECAYSGSPTAIETRVAPIHDLPISVSDFHLLTSNEREIADFATKFDKLIRSSADGGEISERGTRNIEAREGTIIGGGLMIDGEKMPPTLLSRLRRVIVLPFQRGEFDYAAIHTGWKEYQAIHTAIGHAIIAYVHACVNEHEQKFARRIRETENGFELRLFTRYRKEHPESSEQIARAMAKCYARPVTGAYLADCAVGIPGIIEQTFEVVYGLMCKQIQFITDGGASCVDRDWIIRTMRTLLDDHIGHALTMQEQELDPATYGRLGRYGYERYGDDGWIPRGVYLCNVSDDQSAYYFKTEQLDEKLRRQAEREHIKWTYTPQTLPKALVKWEIVTPEYDEHRQFKRSAQQPYIGPDGNVKQQRRLCVPASIFETVPQDEQETPPPADTEQKIDTSQAAEVTDGQDPLYQEACSILATFPQDKRFPDSEGNPQTIPDLKKALAIAVQGDQGQRQWVSAVILYLRKMQQDVPVVVQKERSKQTSRFFKTLVPTIVLCPF